MDTLDLSDFFKTKTESINFSTRLQALVEKIYTNNFDLEKALIEEFGMSKKDKFVTLLINNKVNVNSQTDISNFFKKLIEKISTLSTLSITIAFEPDAKTLKTISEWVLLNTKKQYLFDIKTDESLVAGVEILFNGKRFNYSVIEKFNSFVNEELINSYLMLASKKTNTNSSSNNHEV